MAQSTDSIKKWLTPAYLSRSERNLILALAIALSSTCVGRTFRLTEFLDSSAKTEGQFSASIAGDTLAPTGCDQPLRLSYVPQEALIDPSKKASLSPRFRELANSINSIRTVCRSPLVGPLDKSKGNHGARFDHGLETFDRLTESSERVFTQPGQSATDPRGLTGPKGASRVRPGGGTPEPYLANANGSFTAMRMRPDSVLREGSVEKLIPAQGSTDRIIYRRLFVAIFLFGVGMAPAVILTRRGSQFETRRRRYETLLEESINPIQIVDHEGRTQYVNPAYERWMGSSMKGLLGLPGFQRVKALDGSCAGGIEFWNCIFQTLKLGRAWSGEVEFHKEGGEKAYAWLVISPIVGVGGGLLECISIYHDVTERRELARKLEESQEKYQNIVESSLDGIVVIQEGKLVFVNPSAIRIFGYDSVEDMMAASFSDTIAPSSRSSILGGQEAQLAGEDILRVEELKGLTKDGKVLDLELNARLISWNGRPAVQALFRDITKRKLLEEELALWLRDQETLSVIDRQLVSSVDLQTVLNTICFQAKTLTRADLTGVMMMDPASKLVRWSAAEGNWLPLRNEPFHPGRVLLGIIQKTEPTTLHGFGTNPDLPVEEFPPFKEEKIASIACFPLNVEHQIRGQLVLGYREYHELSAREIRLLNSLAEKSSLALTNAQLYNNLVEREQERELLSGARVNAQEEERRRIAREIHDSLGQILTAVKFSVEILEDAASLQGEEDRRRIADIKELLDSAMSEAREISHNLMPSVLVDFGLAPALQLLCDQFSKVNNLAVHVHTQEISRRIDPGIEVGLYRIAQEALNNVAKHAAAREVNVQLIGDSRSLRLIVEDDGRGFRAERLGQRLGIGDGMGLVSMRERAASFSGIFTLDSSPGRGTEIIVEVPLTEPQADGQNSDSSCR